ncbi:hypothetical protein FB45DRAFT_873109 [Roridomyces roridus]|uniref:Uncharacterized protein n=1 Tax=Roridomyces roridus TaxID=1738132 RepID=A0AAD7FFC4_9AGAR|nr:hypothetical protein FB45DRAFT_873109 [Roridomyces roridus]
MAISLPFAYTPPGNLDPALVEPGPVPANAASTTAFSVITPSTPNSTTDTTTASTAFFLDTNNATDASIAADTSHSESTDSDIPELVSPTSTAMVTHDTHTRPKNPRFYNPFVHISNGNARMIHRVLRDMVDNGHLNPRTTASSYFVLPTDAVADINGISGHNNTIAHLENELDRIADAIRLVEYSIFDLCCYLRQFSHRN